MERLWNANYTRVMLTNFTLFFSFYLLTPLLPLYLSETFGATKDMIGLVLSGYIIAALVMRPVAGVLVDTFPRRTVLIACVAVYAACFGGYLAAGTVMWFAVARTVHGAPFGATTVANSTMAVDVLPASRRNEGIGYYGLSNNLASAVAPTVGVALYHYIGNFDILFAVSLLAGAIGVVSAWGITASKQNVAALKAPLGLPTDRRSSQKSECVQSAQSAVNNTTKEYCHHMPDRQSLPPHYAACTAGHSSLHTPHSAKLLTQRSSSLPKWHHLFLLRGWFIAANLAFFGFCWGLLSNYLAIYSKECLGITGGTGTFFAVLSAGLILSRLQGAHALRDGRMLHVALQGIVLSCAGYALFAAATGMAGYYTSAFLIGLGNGHMWPAFQNMIVSIATAGERGAANSTILTAWDGGMGLGILLGGIVSEHLGYAPAFIMAAMVHAVGFVVFLFITRQKYVFWLTIIKK